MFSLIKLTILRINEYGIKLLLLIFFFEFINLYRNRLFDFITVKKYSSSLEPYVPTPYYILYLIRKNESDIRTTNKTSGN